MKYVHVQNKSKPDKHDLNPAIINQNGLCLISLIEGFRAFDFNTHTIFKVVEFIEKYRILYVDPVNGIIYIDSGGYSVIVGEVHPTAIPRMVQCFNFVMKNMVGGYGRIFSLDISWSKKFRSMNTKASILEFNEYSLRTARTILLEDEEVRSKYFFVWHSKMQGQYEVWCHLYDQFGLNEVIQHRAVGGLVGLRGITRIHFSPFIGIAYRCLLDYLDAENFSHDFSIHFLGCYLLQDRFVMALLDALFRRYLEGEAEVVSSYDSVNYSHRARMDRNLPLYQLEEGKLVQFDNLTDAPEWLLHDIYGDDPILGYIKNEITRRKANIRLEQAGAFAPLNIHSNRQIDLHFELTVARFGLAELFFKHVSFTAIKHEFDQALIEVKQSLPAIYTPHVLRCIEDSVGKIYRFHRWFVNSRTRENLDALMRQFIQAIGFPADLR